MGTGTGAFGSYQASPPWCDPALPQLEPTTIGREEESSRQENEAAYTAGMRSRFIKELQGTREGRKTLARSAKIIRILDDQIASDSRCQPVPGFYGDATLARNEEWVYSLAEDQSPEIRSILHSQSWDTYRSETASIAPAPTFQKGESTSQPATMIKKRRVKFASAPVVPDGQHSSSSRHYANARTMQS
ncbi:hypothetical protein DL93DRAFT_2169343 [Clavulina sp. PMI_390]|nr:hypothetical protein DL93DRAFT_2169343 [Clavulina sp. PMI_390]